MAPTKRTLSLLLAALMLLCLTPLVSAADPVFTTPEAAAEYVRAAMLRRETSIPFTYRVNSEEVGGQTPDEISACLNAKWEQIDDLATAHTGEANEGDYLRNHFDRRGSRIGYSYPQQGDTFDGSITVTAEYLTTAAEEQAVQNAVAAALESLALDGKSDYEKAEAITAFICDNVEYDYEHLNDESYKLKGSAYGALINGQAVCQGYANLFYRMALEAGLGCRIITGTADNGSVTDAHAWNIVRVNGRWYNHDVTWRDTGRTMNYDLKGRNGFTDDHFADAEFRTEAFRNAYPIEAEAFDPNTAEPLSEDWVTLSFSAAAYTGAAFNPSVAVKNAAGEKLVKNRDYTVSIPAGRTAVGSYVYTVTGKGSYTGTVRKTLTVKPAAAETLKAANVTLSVSSAVYNGSAFTPSVTVKNAAGKKLVKNTDYTVSIPAGRTDAGSYTYTVTGKGAYGGTVKKTFTVKPAPLSAANVALSVSSAAYTGKAFNPSVTVKNAVGAKLTKNTDYAVSIPAGRTRPGAYTYTVTGRGNYSGTIKKTLTVTEALKAANVTLSFSSAVYSGKTMNPGVTVKNAAGVKLTKNVDYTVSIPAGRTRPGTYTYVVTGIGLYSGRISKTLTVRAK